MALVAADWERINIGLVRLYRELDTERHVRVMLEILHDLVPADSLVLNYFKPPQELRCVTLPEAVATEENVALVGRYSHQSPFGPYYVATQDASWKMTTDFMPVEEFHKLDIHRLALGPMGINYQMGGMLGAMEGVAHILTLHRTHRGFTEHERELLNALHPHLVTSFVNASMMSRANRSLSQLQAVMETAPGAYGYFNRDRSVAWMQPRAQEWLAEFFPEEARFNGNVPHSLAELLRASGTEANAPQSMTRKGASESLALFLSPSPLGGWLLRLERKANVVPSHFRPLPELSARENDVLRWMVEGKRNAEIASILGISPRTVEKHVEVILATLEVENRACAILRAMELCAAPPRPIVSCEAAI